MELYLSGKDRTLIAKIGGEIDHCSAGEISKSIDSALTRTGAVNLVLDLSGVSFMDSSGLGMIMGRCAAVESLDGNVALTGASGVMERIINMSGINEKVIVAKSINDGIREARKNVH